MVRGTASENHSLEIHVLGLLPKGPVVLCSLLAGSNSCGVTGYQLSSPQAIRFYGLMLARTNVKKAVSAEGR